MINRKDDQPIRWQGKKMTIMKAMKIPRVDLGPQEGPLKDEIMRAISSIIDSKEFILGKNVAELERKVGAYMGVEDAIGVATGTDAMTLSLNAVGISKGDEVITTPFTMAANVEAIMHNGARPVFCDVDPETFNIIPSEIEEKISARTKAILPVHLFGNPCEIDKIVETAQSKGIPLLEDACQAFGAEYKGKKCGSFGDFAALSFFPTKNFSCYGDGGMVLLREKKYSEKIRILRAHGQEKKYVYKHLGWNSRLDEIQAAIMLPKLRLIDSWNAQTTRIAQKYNSILSKIDELIVPKTQNYAIHVFHLYTLRAQRRGELVQHLAQRGISTTINYPEPLHLQQAYSSFKYKRGDFPNAEMLCEQSLSLPLYVGLTDEQVNYVCGAIEEFYR